MTSSLTRTEQVNLELKVAKKRALEVESDLAPKSLPYWQQSGNQIIGKAAENY